MIWTYFRSTLDAQAVNLYPYPLDKHWPMECGELGETREWTEFNPWLRPDRNSSIYMFIRPIGTRMWRNRFQRQKTNLKISRPTIIVEHIENPTVGTFQRNSMFLYNGFAKVPHFLSTIWVSNWLGTYNPDENIPRDKRQICRVLSWYTVLSRLCHAYRLNG